MVWASLRDQRKLTHDGTLATRYPGLPGRHFDVYTQDLLLKLASSGFPTSATEKCMK